MIIKDNFKKINNSQKNSTAMAPFVSLVVPNYNGRHLLPSFFQSLSCTRYHNYEIILVDNASEDDSIEFAKKACNDIKIVESIENNGFGSAVNKGMVQAKGDYIVLVNTDILFTTNWLDKLVESAQEKPKAGIIGALPVKSEYKDVIVSFPQPRYVNITAVSAATVLIKREVIAKIGLFDENFFMYCDDTDYCWRANLAGFDITYDREAIVYHLGGGSGSSSEKLRFERLKSGFYFIIKHFGLNAMLYAGKSYMVKPIIVSLFSTNKRKRLINALKWNIMNINSTRQSRNDIYTNRRISKLHFYKKIKQEIRIHRANKRYYMKMQKFIG